MNTVPAPVGFPMRQSRLLSRIAGVTAPLCLFAWLGACSSPDAAQPVQVQPPSEPAAQPSENGSLVPPVLKKFCPPGAAAKGQC